MKKSELTEDNIEIFIRDNKDAFNKCDASIYHNDHFLLKLINNFKKFISIVPYLWKVFAAVVIVWAITIFIWWLFNWPSLCTILMEVYRQW